MQELIQSLTSQLGINETQAKGGAGLLLKAAQDQLAGADFEKLASIFGGSLGELVNSAPTQSGGMLGGTLGKLAGAIGVEKLSGITQALGGFSQLGIDQSTVTKFIPVVLKFIEEKGGVEAKAIVSKLFPV